jgi:ATP-dependent Lon protease
VTIATALVSLLSGRKVRPDVGMTGEITLRGQVLPVGGIKEKVLAAHRAGLKKVILPKRNEKDLEDVLPEVRKALKFVLVERVDEVFEAALEADRQQGKRPARRRAARAKKKGES